MGEKSVKDVNSSDFKFLFVFEDLLEIFFIYLLAFILDCKFYLPNPGYFLSYPNI